MEWIKTRIGDCIQCNPSIKLEKGKEYPIIDIDKITIGRKFATNAETLIYSNQSGCKFQKGDTLMARITPCLENGKMAQARIADKGIGSTELFVFRGMENVTDNDFVYYFIKQQYIRDLAANSMSGASGRQRADLKFVKKIQFALPPLPIQHKIASILSTYDNLIENNTKRIKLLEQMAENLYKEWFVRFRFPGHENMEMENGLPKGWKRAKLSEIASYSTIKINSSIIDFYVSTENMLKDCAGVDTNMFIEAPEGNVTKVCVNDILVSNIRPYFKKIWLADKESGCSNDVLNIKANKGIDSSFLYYTIRKDSFFEHMVAGSNGTKMPRGNKNFTMKYQVIVPNDIVMKRFSNIAQKINEQKQNLLKQSSILAHQRDLLLPRLMSGKLEVKV